MSSVESRSALKAFLLSSLLLLISMCITYLFCEAAFRIYVHHTIREQLISTLIASLGKTEGVSQFDPDLGFRYRPGIPVRNFGRFIDQFTTSQYGFVANDIDPTAYPIEKPADEYRIAILGDSFTVDISDTIRWSDLVQDYLNHSHSWRDFVGGKFTRVINFGLDGTGMPQFAAVSGYAKRFSPDLVIVNFIIDDVRRKFFYRSGEAFNPTNNANLIVHYVDNALLPALPWYGIYPELLTATVGTYLHWETHLSAQVAYGRAAFAPRSEALTQSMAALERIRCNSPHLVLLHEKLINELLHRRDDAERWPQEPDLVGLETKFMAEAANHKFDVVTLSDRYPLPSEEARIKELFNERDGLGHNSEYGVAVYANWVFHYLLDWSQTEHEQAIGGSHNCGA